MAACHATRGECQYDVGTKHQACAIETVKQAEVDHVHGTPADHGYVKTLHPDQWTLVRTGVTNCFCVAGTKNISIDAIIALNQTTYIAPTKTTPEIKCISISSYVPRICSVTMIV